ncbi:MAG TPA: hypothetical protein VGR61_00795 [Candidatus Dormibacteraeota bacterium]|nr:hypothetical protein [Candidatus Dormibacteraeota bacterium]
MRVRSRVLALTPRRAVATWGLALTAILCALGGQFAAVQAAAADRFEVQVSAGYDGYARQDDWAPVRVTVKNNGDDFRGRLRVDDAAGSGSSSGSTSFNKGCCGPPSTPISFGARQVEVVLPAHSTRHYTLYVAGAQRPRVTLLEGTNAVAVSEVAQGLIATGTGNATLLVAVVSDQVDNRATLSAVSRVL